MRKDCREKKMADYEERRFFKAQAVFPVVWRCDILFLEESLHQDHPFPDR
jgi:hypothetical protein